MMRAIAIAPLETRDPCPSCGRVWPHVHAEDCQAPRLTVSAGVWRAMNGGVVPK